MAATSVCVCGISHTTESKQTLAHIPSYTDTHTHLLLSFYEPHISVVHKGRVWMHGLLKNQMVLANV